MIPEEGDTVSNSTLIHGTIADRERHYATSGNAQGPIDTSQQEAPPPDHAPPDSDPETRGPAADEPDDTRAADAAAAEARAEERAAVKPEVPARAPEVWDSHQQKHVTLPTT